jgi:GNAT superfamily N-acetyltransferase
LTKPQSSATGHVRLRPAVPEDAAELAALHTAVADHLTSLYGEGPWSSRTSEKGVLYAMRNSKVFVATEDAGIVATLRLASKKPWAIDVRYFTKCEKVLYLLAMAVAPARQRQGIGRRCLEEATRIARALRLMRFASTRTMPTRVAAPFISAAVIPKGAASPIATRR